MHTKLLLFSIMILAVAAAAPVSAEPFDDFTGYTVEFEREWDDLAGRIRAAFMALSEEFVGEDYDRKLWQRLFSQQIDHMGDSVFQSLPNDLMAIEKSRLEGEALSDFYHKEVEALVSARLKNTFLSITKIFSTTLRNEATPLYDPEIVLEMEEFKALVILEIEKVQNKYIVLYVETLISRE